MARSHHRKKHKEHLREFKDRERAPSPAAKTKAAIVFAIAGTILGLAITYFGTQSSITWMVIGSVAGAVVGYAVGRKVDS